MSSKRKAAEKEADNYAAIRCVEEARRKCGCTLVEFFMRAALAKNSAGVFSWHLSLLPPKEFAKAIKIEVEKFKLLRVRVDMARARYKVPKYLVTFAEKVNASHPPQTFRKDRERSFRPSIAMRA